VTQNNGGCYSVPFFKPESPYATAFCHVNIQIWLMELNVCVIKEYSFKKCIIVANHCLNCSFNYSIWLWEFIWDKSVRNSIGWLETKYIMFGFCTF
jgi:hypothetical protein